MGMGCGETVSRRAMFRAVGWGEEGGSRETLNGF